MGVKEWLFNPYEEPGRDPYDLNHHGVDDVMILPTIFPLAGISVVIGSLAYAAMEPGNDYNIANTAWNTAVVGTVMQILWVVFFAILLAI